MAPKGSPEPHIGCSNGALPVDTEKGTRIKSAEMKNVIAEATYVVKAHNIQFFFSLYNFSKRLYSYT